MDDDGSDQFPIGMRILAVDDDTTSLLFLENLLRTCQYHVTTTTQVNTALRLLREDKDKFDLVICDVKMPGMDGFKFLELVGLEMDPPVVMLSENDDKKLVMKGISHGACDYLLKPVRIEELKNIWQHVFRKKEEKNKCDSKEHNKICNRGLDKSNSDSGNGAGNSDKNGKLTKKRKNYFEAFDEEHKYDHGNPDLSRQKKPRVVWSMELHHKFVTAVNQLGIDKAVPKKILDLMDDEKLTRENVASHLQKYRLHLKRSSCVADQQANMLASLGNADPSYLKVDTVTDSGQFHDNALRSFPFRGKVSGLNSSAGRNVHGLPSSEILQLGREQNNIKNCANDQLKFQSAILEGNQNGVQVMPVFIGLEELQQSQGVTSVQNINTTTTCGSQTLPLCIPNNALMLEEHPQDTEGGRVYEKSSSEDSEENSEFSFALLDQGSYSNNWSIAMQPYGIHTNSYPTENMNCVHLQGWNLSGPSSVTSYSSQSHDSTMDIHSQGVIFTDRPEHIRFQVWDDNYHDAPYYSNVICGSNSSTPVNSADAITNLEFQRNLDFNFCDPLQMKHDGIVELTEETSLKPQQKEYIMNQQKSWHCCFSNNLCSLDDLHGVKQEQDKVKLLDGDFICDNHSGGASM